MVLSLELQGTSHAGCAEIDAGHARCGPAQGMFGRLRGSAAGNQNREVFAVRSGRPKEMIVGAASRWVLPPSAIWRRGSRPAADRDAARKRRALPPRRGRLRRPLHSPSFIDSRNTRAHAPAWSHAWADSTRSGAPARPLRSHFLPLSGVRLRHLRQHRVQVERSRFLTRRELHEALDLLRHHRLHRVHLRDVIDHPVPVGIGVEVGPLEGVATQVENMRHSKLDQRFRP